MGIYVYLEINLLKFRYLRWVRISRNQPIEVQVFEVGTYI